MSHPYVRVFVVVLAGALVAAAQTVPDREWEAFGFDKAETLVWASDELGERAHSLSLPLTVVVARGSNWTAARVQRQLRKTASTLDGCGISLGPVEYVRARLPTNRDHVDMSGEGAVPEEVRRLSDALPGDVVRPLAFFVGRLDGDSAVARSFRRAPGVTLEQAAQYSYLNTVWVSYRAHWMERFDEEYSPVAHELGHVLCECGHTGGQERHLLHDKRNFLGSKALPGHCDVFRQSHLIQRLSEPKLFESAP